MTDFTDRVILRLNGSLPVVQLPTDAVKNIWWFEDGKWAPIGFTNHGNSYLTLTDYNNNPPDTPLNLFAYTIAGTGGEPVLTIDRGVTVQKDLTAGGFVCSNQGELWLGSGRDNQLDVPKIILQNSGASILNGGGFCDIPPIPTGHAGSGSFPAGQPAGTYYLRTDESGPYHNRVYKYDGSNWNDTTPTNTAASQLFRSTDAIFGEAADTIFKSSYATQTGWSWSKVNPASNYAGKYFDTLYLTKLDGTPAHLDLGDLTVEGQLKLQSANKKIFGVAAGDNGTADNYAYLIPINPPNGTLGLGTYAYPFEWIDVYSVFTNEIRNLQSFPRIRMALRRLLGARSSVMMQNSALDQEETVTAVVIDNDEVAGLKQKHLNGLVDEWYSDDEVTLKATVDGSTGYITAAGLTINGNAKVTGYAQFNNDAKLIWVNTSTLEVQNAAGAAYSGNLNLNNLFIAGNINPLGAQGYIGFNTKLRLSGDFQIADGHVVSSLNPSGSVGLGSPTEPWTGVTAQTVYTESIKHLNGSDWSFPWNGGTVTNGITINSSVPQLTLGTGLRLQSTAGDNFQLYTGTNTPNPNWQIGYGNGSGGIDQTRESISSNAGNIYLNNARLTLSSGYDWNGNIRRTDNNSGLFIAGGSGASLSGGGAIAVFGASYSDGNWAGVVRALITNKFGVYNYSSGDVFTVDTSGNSWSKGNHWINGSWLNSSSTLYIGGASGAAVTMYLNGNVNPIADNAYGLGSGSNRWAGISAVNGYFASQVSANNFWINGSWLNSSSTLYIGGASGAAVTMYMNGNVNPISDNAYGLGSGSNRWAGISAITGYFSSVDCSGLVHGGGGSGDAFRIGDDCYLVDINNANRIGIQGAQDRSQAGFQFGSGGMWLYRDSSYLRCSSGFVADGTVVVGTYGSGGTGSAVYFNSSHQLCQGTSLREYKTNIETLNDASWIYNLHPVTFDWKDARDAELFGRQIGLIAEEVQPYAPLLTFNDEQTGQLRGVMYEKLAVPMLVELQKLRKRIEALESQLSQKETAA